MSGFDDLICTCVLEVHVELKTVKVEKINYEDLET